MRPWASIASASSFASSDSRSFAASSGETGNAGYSVELAHHADGVGEAAVLDDPAVGDPDEVDHRDRCAAAGRLDAQQRAAVGAGQPARDRDPLAVGDELLDLELGVGEGLGEDLEEGAHSCDPLGQAGRDAVAGEVVGDELVDRADVAGVQQRAVEALDQGDVLAPAQMITWTVPPSTDQAAPAT